MECRNSPVTKTPPRDLPTIPGVTSPVSDEPPTEASQNHLRNSSEEKPAGGEWLGVARLLGRKCQWPGSCVPSGEFQGGNDGDCHTCGAAQDPEGPGRDWGWGGWGGELSSIPAFPVNGAQEPQER